MIRSVLVVLASLAFFSSVGCVRSQSDVWSAHEVSDETVRIYDLPPAMALGIAVDVLRTEGASEVEQRSNYAFASFSPDPVAWGTEAAVWVEPVGKTQSKVAVVTKRKVSIAAATRLTETTFHEKFAERAREVTTSAAAASSVARRTF